MTDAISRSAAMNALSRVFGIPLDYDGNCDETCDEAFAAIEALPALDVESVIHAKWIEDGYYEKPSVCSHCGEEAFYISTFRELFDYDWNENLVSCGYEEDREYVHSKRCHNCGAIMDYEEDENAAD